jgi:lactate permease
MWNQVYTPVGGSLALSALCAALPLFVMLLSLAVLRTAAWKAALAGVLTALFVAVVVYAMPMRLAVNATLFGAAFGLFPIAWVVFWAIALYRLTVETGQFDIIRASIGGLTRDARLQALLIAFAFGAFIEGASGFGTPVAVASAMLAGLGFSPFNAAAICLIANTAPVAFGAIATPIVTLASVTGLPIGALSAEVGRICAPIALFLPAYLMLVMGGRRTLAAVWPAALVAGLCFGVTQFLVSNFLAPYLTDILSSFVSITGLVLLLRVWQPRDEAPAGPVGASAVAGADTAAVLRAWTPYIFLVFFGLLWGYAPFKALLDKASVGLLWHGLDGQVQRLPPAVAKAGPYAAKFNLNLLSASGTAVLLAFVCAALALRVGTGRTLAIVARTARDLSFSMLTIALVLALAYLMNYSGATATLGLAFAATGIAFPFFSAYLGWLGTFLTGSDTSTNALFGNLQVVTANRLDLSPALMAASNSSGGVMGKMISLQSISVAAAATGMAASDESKLFRFTLKHSIFLAGIVGLVVLIYAYILPAWSV